MHFKRWRNQPNISGETGFIIILPEKRSWFDLIFLTGSFWQHFKNRKTEDIEGHVPLWLLLPCLHSRLSSSWGHPKDLLVTRVLLLIRGRWDFTRRGRKTSPRNEWKTFWAIGEVRPQWSDRCVLSENQHCQRGRASEPPSYLRYGQSGTDRRYVAEIWKQRLGL